MQNLKFPFCSGLVAINSLWLLILYSDGCRVWALSWKQLQINTKLCAVRPTTKPQSGSRLSPVGLALYGQHSSIYTQLFGKLFIWKLQREAALQSAMMHSSMCHYLCCKKNICAKVKIYHFGKSESHTVNMHGILAKVLENVMLNN